MFSFLFHDVCKTNLIVVNTQHQLLQIMSKYLKYAISNSKKLWYNYALLVT